MNYSVVDQSWIKKVYKKRDNWAHKGNFGKVLVLGGSLEYTGSPAIVALAAMRAGADLSKIFAPKRAADIAASFSPEIIAIPFEKEYLDSDAFYDARKLSSWANVIALGNGLGTGSNQGDFVNMVLKDIKKKFVVDADGIKLMNPNLLSSEILITPNTYEFNVLFGTNLSTNIEERAKIVKEKAKEYGTNILLKGHVDIVSDGDQLFLNKVNSVYMTKGGTGDSLCGICAGLIGQGAKIIDAACAGVFINGYTGKYLARLKRESLSPLDIVDNIYSTITKWRYQ